MLSFTLSNGTQITIGISIIKRTITITSREKQGDLFKPDQTLAIPISDVKDLIAKGKQLADLVK